MSAYRRYIRVNLIIIGSYSLFLLLSLVILHFPTGVNVGAALVTLVLMSVVYATQQRRS